MAELMRLNAVVNSRGFRSRWNNENKRFTRLNSRLKERLPRGSTPKRLPKTRKRNAFVN